MERLYQQPLYKQLESKLRESILQGKWARGEMLPNEQDIAQMYSVSQGTVKRALDELANSNMIIRVQGRGTFVNTLSDEQSFSSFWRIHMNDDDDFNPMQDLTNRWVSVDYTLPKTPIEHTLAGQLDNYLYHVHRVRLYRGVPFIYEQVVLPHHMFRGIENKTDLPNALYPYFQKEFNISVANVEDSLSIIHPTPKIANALNKNRTEPLLYIQRQAVDMKGQFFEYRQSYVNPDMAYYKI